MLGAPIRKLDLSSNRINTEKILLGIFNAWERGRHGIARNFFSNPAAARAPESVPHLK
jgi:hypothetical protein